MSEDKELKILILRRALFELEQRISYQGKWTQGEIEIFKLKVRKIRSQILDLTS